jgi:hypothetical protein
MLLATAVLAAAPFPFRHAAVLPFVPRVPVARMGAKRKNTMSRREVLDGSSVAKSFYDPDGFRASLPPGWSPALVLSIGAVAANYGSSVRSRLFSELQELGSGVKNHGGASHMPIVTLSPGRKSGQVSVEITAPVSAPDAIDAIWAADADTGEVFAGRRFLPKERSSLPLNVDRGRRFVPYVHCVIDGVWEGDSIVAEA